jgi:hypothetical protein
MENAFILESGDRGIMLVPSLALCRFKVLLKNSERIA